MAVVGGQPQKMIVVLLGWLVLANIFTFSTFSGFAEIPSANRYVPEKNYAVLKEVTFFRFDFKIKVFQPFEHQFNMVQHFIYTGSKYTNVV